MRASTSSTTSVRVAPPARVNRSASPTFISTAVIVSPARRSSASPPARRRRRRVAVIVRAYTPGGPAGLQKSDEQISRQGGLAGGLGRSRRLALQLSQQRLEELHREADDVRPRSLDGADQRIVLLADRVAAGVPRGIALGDDLFDRRIVVEGHLRGDVFDDAEVPLLEDHPGA